MTRFIRRLKRIVLQLMLIGGGFCIILIAIASTTGFKIQKNPMDHFFSQHKEIDSIHIDESISKEAALEDIDFMVETLREVHPDLFHSIESNKFYGLTDSIKQSIPAEIRREDLLGKLSPLFVSINDGHTNIKFPEISNEQDNPDSFKDEHSSLTELIGYKRINENVGYIFIKDFVMDKNEFRNELEGIFEQIHKDSIQALIIDIRDNPGGNSELADLLTSYIFDKPFKSNSKILVKRSEQYYTYMKGYFSWWFRPFLRFFKQINDYRLVPVGEIFEDIKGEKYIDNSRFRFTGDTYLLINSNTSSTALGFATVFKDYEMGLIIGEPTKSEVNEFGDIYSFDLPNSRLWVWCSAKRYIRPSGEMTRGGLQPDILTDTGNEDILQFTTNLILNRK